MDEVLIHPATREAALKTVLFVCVMINYCSGMIETIL
jgi:hypothetical protein